MSSYSEHDYWDTVKTIAKEAVEEYPDDERAQEDFVRESVDGDQYVIYDAAHEVVLRASDNEPDADELGLGIGRILAVTDQIGGVHRPAPSFERLAELIEAPAALRGAMHHDNVLAHSLLPLTCSRGRDAR